MRGYRVRGQVVREHYLRDDIYSGTPLDPECPSTSYLLADDARHYLIVDTNVVLQQVGTGSNVSPSWCACTSSAVGSHAARTHAPSSACECLGQQVVVVRRLCISEVGRGFGRPEGGEGGE